VTEGPPILWASFDTPEPTFPDTEVRSWPPQVREAMIHHELIVEAGPLGRIACPDCPDGHIEEVIERPGADGRPRYFIPCPQSLRVEIPPEALRRWRLNFERIVAVVASALSMLRRPLAIVPGRLWRLGKTQWQGASREVLLARGLAWADGEAIAHRVGPAGRPIVLVADQTPAVDIWSGRVPALVPLSRVATLGATAIEVDVTHMMMLVRDADARAERASLLPVAPKDRTRVINRHVRAAMKKQLDQDAYVAAYKLHGSARKAEAALREEGIRVHFSTIARAVKRARQTEDIARTANSQSVCRTVASHRRDSGRKPLNFPKVPDSK